MYLAKVPKGTYNACILADNSPKILACVLTRPIHFRCDGSLKVIHYDRSPGATPFQDLKTLRLTGKRYRNLTRHLKPNRLTISITAEGSCCWRIFSKVKFRGPSKVIHNGFDGNPKQQIKSATRISC